MQKIDCIICICFFYDKNHLNNLYMCVYLYLFSDDDLEKNFLICG